MKINQIKFPKKMLNSIYNPYNKEKLNLSLFEEEPVNIYLPTSLSEENNKIYEQMKDSGYNMFN